MAPSGLPSGTLTCVFTDIEGSTRMLRTLGPVYEQVQQRHDAVLREVWAAHRGHEVKTLGDGFMLVFADARDAVRATVAAQRALAAVRWPTELPVRVRMGMHTGYARPVDGDYTALVVNRAARVIGAARGGQILLTDETAAEIDAAGGCADVDLEPLGRFRVRDFDEPVALLAATGEGVEPVDAPPRVRPADGHNLVRPTTSLLGRHRDLARLRELVEAGRVTTLAGPGGVGKTRLATELALRVAPDWTDGAWFVDLAPLGEGALVGDAIGDAVGAPGTPGAPRWPEVLEYLEARRVLIVLDNCEHVSDAAARAAAELVAACPDAAVLATSRGPLRLRGERVHRLAPLVQESAADLFVDRAGLAGDPDRTAVAELVAELDGLPLAIELAAARAASVPVAEILRQVRRSHAVVTSHDPTLPDRQRSLDRLLDWSWHLLSPAARTVLGRLSVFAGSFDVDAAEAVGAADGIDAATVTELLWTLMDASLVRPEETVGATRYRLLSTVRAHAAARAGEEELAAAGRRLAQSLLARVGPDCIANRSWLVTMQLEVDNARRATATAGDPATAHALAWSIGHLHDVTDSYAIGIGELTAFLDQHRDRIPERVALMALLADLHLRTTDLDRAEALITAAAELAADVGIPSWDDAGLARTRGVLHLRRHDAGRAVEVARRALEDPGLSARGRARLHDVIGIAQSVLGDLQASADAFEDELACASAAGLDALLATIHANLAESYLQLGAQRIAAHHQQIALDLSRQQGQPVLVAFSLMIAARLVAVRQRARDAVVLQTKADDLLAAADYALYDEDARVRDLLLGEAAARLGAAGYGAAVTAARATSAQCVADLAAEILASVGSAPATNRGGT